MHMQYRSHLLAGLFAAASLTAGSAFAADNAPAPAQQSPLQNRSIGYVMTTEFKAIYDTPDGKKECPDGLNEGPREQFKILFPEKPGKKWKITETQLERESEIWFPHTTPDPIPYHYAVGNIAYALNLDGKVGPNDFTSPDLDGEKGIDDQLQRAWGCAPNYRSSSYNLLAFNNWRKYAYNLIVIELTDVDDLQNDDDVTLTTYRGLDKVMTDATGATYLPGGTERLDMRWGKQFIQKFHGKIVNGVLRTDGADYLMPSAGNGMSIADIRYYKTQWRLKLTPDRAEGLMGAYMDIDDWNAASNQQRSTHHQAYGQASTPSLYRAMRKMADYNPDPKTGEMTAISMALKVMFTQVFIKHPEQAVSQNAPAPAKTTAGQE
jgi:hypothetical protein